MVEVDDRTDVAMDLNQLDKLGRIASKLTPIRAPDEVSGLWLRNLCEECFTPPDDAPVYSCPPGIVPCDKCGRYDNRAEHGLHVHHYLYKQNINDLRAEGGLNE